MRRIAVAEAAALILGLVCPVGVYAEHDAKTSVQITESASAGNPILGIPGNAGSEYDIQYGNITVTAKAGGQEVEYSDGGVVYTETVDAIPVIKGTSSTYTVLLKTGALVLMSAVRIRPR